MESLSETTVNAAGVTSPPSSSSSPPPHVPPPAVATPCAACKILRRRCGEKCGLAPYFPPHDPIKFTTAHRVFGASNIIKFLQELPKCQRADAVSSMVYEANTRLRDPVYGSAGAICHLQKQVNELQAQLAQTRAELELVNLQAKLMARVCTELPLHQPYVPNFDSLATYSNLSSQSNNFGYSFSEQNRSPDINTIISMLH